MCWITALRAAEFLMAIIRTANELIVSIAGRQVQSSLPLRMCFIMLL